MSIENIKKEVDYVENIENTEKDCKIIELGQGKDLDFNIEYGELLKMGNGCYIIESKAEQLYVHDNYENRVSERLGRQVLIQKVYGHGGVEELISFLEKNDIEYKIIGLNINVVSEAKKITLFEENNKITYTTGSKQPHSSSEEAKSFIPPYLKGKSSYYNNTYKCIDYWISTFEFRIWINQLAKKWREERNSDAEICRDKREAASLRGVHITKPDCN